MSAAAAVAGLGSALAFGVASAGQHQVASSGDSAAALDPRLLLRLVRSRTWLLAGAVELVAVGLQILALRWGAVSLVQPLLVLGLPVAVLLAARLQRQRVVAREWLGIFLCAVGVATVAVLLPGTGDTPAPTGSSTLAALAAVLVVAAVAGLLAGRTQPTLAGAAAGVAAGVGAAALALCGRLLDEPFRLLADWPPYLALAAGLLALQLGQAAFQHHRLGAPLAAVTLTEPITAVALSSLVLHEQLASSPGSRIAAAAAVMTAALGVALLISEQRRVG